MDGEDVVGGVVVGYVRADVVDGMFCFVPKYGLGDGCADFIGLRIASWCLRGDWIVWLNLCSELSF